ncbi:DUF3034 family protein [Roseateles depolymerans]|uniref:Uncharacterized protein n=1 Tax=Roseateles depolymerans TaxID=76731 RepID=A0A0U3D5U4_9BURK|nr:DUF3034 family protein [Roseateles depolymerans]ALV08998.1 hypothetical protein RD2015_4557 [Roseateles depolymerans]REG10081.1 DUF3034 family protein [Roseateles depolymerans]
MTPTALNSGSHATVALIGRKRTAAEAAEGAPIKAGVRLAVVWMGLGLGLGLGLGFGGAAMAQTATGGAPASSASSSALASPPPASSSAPAPSPFWSPKGKLLLTGGVSSIDGAAGGGLTPWALTGSYATEGQIGTTAYYTRLPTQDYGLTGYGALVAFGERAELSIARQDFSAGGTGAALNLPGLHLKQTILGAKLRLGGDAILDADTWMPQLALGVEYKSVDAAGLNPTLSALGAKRHGVDVYLSATKLLLAQSTLVNLTLRASRANQNGLLGFGGTASHRYSLLPEVSVAYLINKNWAVGAEYRMKPDKLNPSVLGDALKEQDWKDVFVAWAPTKNFSLTAAYVDLGKVVPGVQPRRQRGVYGSIQLAY